jgi:hypothetical protein
MTTNSSINPAGINENFPLTGVSNDPAVFRANFTAIKHNLNTANYELSKALTHSVRGDISVTSFNDNIITNGVLKSTAVSRHDIAGLQTGAFNVDYTNGSYQTVAISGDSAISLTNFISEKSGAALVRLQITSDSPSQSISFLHASADLYISDTVHMTDSNKIVMDGGTTIFDIWQTTDASIYIECVGLFHQSVAYIDNVMPITSVTSAAYTTNDATPGIIIGFGITEQTTLYANGVLRLSTYNADTGAITPTVQLVDGLYEFTYTLTNTLGIVSQRHRAGSITIDTVKPPTPNALISYNDAVGAIINPSSTASTTDDTTPGINVGPGIAHMTNLYIDDVLTPSTYDVVTGILTPVTALSDASYAFKYSITDVAGNESDRSTALTIIIDTVAPTTPSIPSSYKDDVTPIVNISNTATATNDTKPGINIGLNITDTLKLYIDGVLAESTYNPVGTLTPVTALSDGVYEFTYTQTDPAGNVSGKSPVYSITIDTASPVTPIKPTSYNDNVGTIINAINTATTTDDTKPGINIGPSITHTTNLYIDNVLTPSTYDTVTGILTPVAALSDASHVFKYSLSDAAGNESEKSPDYTITIDTAPPTTPSIPISYKDDVGTVANTSNTAATTDDTKPGINIGLNITDTIKLYIDGVFSESTYNSDGTLTPVDDLSDGVHKFTYTRTDPAGNVSGKSPDYIITIDTVAPATPLTPVTYDDGTATIINLASTELITNDNMPGINIGVGITDSPKLYVDNVLTASTYNSVTGTLTPNAILLDGIRHCTYSITDAAGNESGRSAGFNIIIDTVEPGTPVAPDSYTDNIGIYTLTESTDATTDDTKPGILIGFGIVDAITLYIGGVITAHDYNPVAGTLAPKQILLDGLHSFTYTLTDVAGNVSLPSPAYSITINTVPPITPTTAPTTYVDNVGGIVSTTSTAPTTDDQTPGINVGTSLAGTPNLYIDGDLVLSKYATGVLTPINRLYDGLHKFAYSVTDKDGLESGVSPSKDITIDTLVINIQASVLPASTDNTLNVTGGGPNVTYAITGGTPPAFHFSKSSGITFSDTVLFDAPATTVQLSISFTVSVISASGDVVTTRVITTEVSAPIVPIVPIPTTPAIAPLSYVDDSGTVVNLTSTSSTTTDTTPGINIPTGLTDTPKLYANDILVLTTYSGVVLTPLTQMAPGEYAFTYTLTNATGESGKSPAINITITAPIVLPTFDVVGSGTDMHGYWLGTAGDGTSKLIVAPKSTEQASVTWGSGGVSRGTTSTTDGIANTTTLFNLGSAAHPAAYYCRALTTGGYSNWYLPAKDEMLTCWSNHLATPFATSNAFGGYCWSSTENDAINAWVQGFITGDQRPDGTKNSTDYARAVRRKTP